MQKHCQNIYKIARLKTNFTQEQVAELIPTSVESVRAYETGQTIPPDEVACRMAHIYESPDLAYDHLMHKSEAARMIFPSLDKKNLPEAILQLQRDVTEFIKCRDDLIDIGCDGIIDDHERVRYDEICCTLDEIVKSVMALKFAKTKQ